jgi:hypothetical protein
MTSHECLQAPCNQALGICEVDHSAAGDRSSAPQELTRILAFKTAQRTDLIQQAASAHASLGPDSANALGSKLPHDFLHSFLRTLEHGVLFIEAMNPFTSLYGNRLGVFSFESIRLLPHGNKNIYIGGDRD